VRPRLVSSFRTQAAHFNVPEPVNEPILGYAKGSPERMQLQQKIKVRLCR